MAEETLKLSNDSFWVQREGNTFKVGLSLEELRKIGDISFIELPDIGEMNEGDPFLHVEASKVASEFSSPLTGNIGKVNYKLLQDAEILSLHDRNRNWIAVFENVVDGEGVNEAQVPKRI